MPKISNRVLAEKDLEVIEQMRETVLPHLRLLPSVAGHLIEREMPVLIREIRRLHRALEAENGDVSASSRR